MPISMHSHSGQFCKHASGLLEDVVLEAIRQDFKVYGLSEHVPRYRAKDLYPEEANLSLGELAHQFSSFVDEAHRLKTKYAEQIILLVGAETEFISEPDMDFLAVLLEHYGPKIEYLVGSVHHANEIPIDFDPETFDRALSSFASSSDLNPEELLISHYLDRQYELLRRFRPAVVGHMDLFRLYRPSLELNGYSSLPPKLLRNIDYACNYGALFELNAAAFRKGWNTAYPGKDIVAIIMSQNGRFTLSDDSHGPQLVGLNYDKLFQYIEEVGINDLWYLSHEGTDGSLVPARLPEHWSTSLRSLWRCGQEQVL